MSFSPNLFLSNLNAKDGLAKPNRFEVILPIPQYINNFIGNSFIEKILNLPNTIIADVTDIIRRTSTDQQSRSDNPSMTRYLSLQCEAAELPGKSLITQDVKIYGPTFKVPYQTQYQDTSLTFLCTNEFYERKLFEKWTESIMPTDTNNLRYAKGNDTRYLTNIKIIQYDEFIRQIYIVELLDAFPISIGNQALSWSDDNFHRLTVQFAYQKYRVVYAGNYDLVQAATSLFGSKLTSFTEKFSSAISKPVGSIFDLVT
jgi:hypothetical protein